MRLSTYREEPMRSQPLPGEASRRRAEEQFKTTKKVNSETKANTPSRQAEAASRLAPGNDTNAGSPGFQNPARCSPDRSAADAKAKEKWETKGCAR